jgi:hypothetical protein
MKPTKEQIVQLLSAWIRQRPGLEFGNYGDVSCYRAEIRSIGKDLAQARQLLRYVELSSISAEELSDAFRDAYSGRLSLTEDKGRPALDYCTGQYWPTEYRRAACAVLASAIWSHFRDHCMPEGELVHNSETGETFKRYKGQRAGDYLRSTLSREFGRSIANRWFN